MRRAIIIDQDDNVATAIDDLQPGESLKLEVGSLHVEVRVVEPIKFGHKVALRPIPKGSSVVKYNETVGTATQDISAGAHVHVHNVTSNRTNARGITVRKVEA
jgi:altronate dehydratase small subunit